MSLAAYALRQLMEYSVSTCASEYQSNVYTRTWQKEKARTTSTKSVGL